MSADTYGNLVPQAFAKNINLSSDTIKIALLGSGYTPNLTSDTHWSDISSHEITGTGYTAGGVTLGSQSATFTAANSWGHSWASATGFTLGQVVRPTTGNGFLYQASVAGTTAGSQPTWPTTLGLTVTDGSVVWTLVGLGIYVFSSSTATWTTATFTANYAAIYDNQTGVSTTSPLIALETFSSPQNPSGVNFSVVPDPILGWFAQFFA